MNELEENGRKFALGITAAFFLLLVVLCLTVRFDEQKKYQEITIQLESVLPQKEVKSAVPKADASKSIAKKLSESTATSTPKVESKKTESKKSVSKAVSSDSAPSPVRNKSTEEPVIKKSVEELMAEQNSVRKKKVEFDESLFDDPSFSEPAENSSAQKKVVPVSSLSGVSAKSDSASAKSMSSGYSSATENNESDSVSDSTRNALEGILETSVSSSTKAEKSGKSKNASSKITGGAISIHMMSGRGRELLYPSSPSISISEENARLIDSKQSVKIQFTVLADGTVPFGEIEFSPASVIPSPIQREIRDQIKRWKFSKDPAGGVATAVFDYTLEIR